MDNAIIISIRPHYADRIFAGDKTLEIRKRGLPHLFGASAFVYATAPVKAIIGGFQIQSVHIREVIDGASADAAFRAWGGAACIGKTAWDEYLDGYSGWLSALTVKDYWTTDEPLFASAWRNFKPPQSWRYAKPREILEIAGVAPLSVIDAAMSAEIAKMSIVAEVSEMEKRGRA